MQIDRLPGLYYDENVTYELSGIGSKIPIFIGVTGNTASDEYKTDGTVALKFTNKTKALADVTKTNETVNGKVKYWYETTGIGKYYDEVSGEVINSNNLLAKTIYEFYEEARLLNNADIGVPYIYVIDLGTGVNLEHWKNALKTAKTLLDASVEIYVGASVKTEGEGENQTKTIKLPCNTTLQGFMATVSHGLATTDIIDDYGLEGSAKNLDLRYAFASFESTNDRISDDTLLKGLTDNFWHSRIGFVEPLLFGKTMARICCTPNNTEPGYYTYRSVDPGVFHNRSKAEMLDLQNHGIIFNSDEHINDKIYPKINLCVSSAFARNPRPADALFHARFNADALLRDVFEACYTQIKANESATNIAYLQTRINKLVNDRVSAEEMIKWNEKEGTGTKLIVSQTTEDPYRLIVSGQIHPVKCTIAILINATVVI